MAAGAMQQGQKHAAGFFPPGEARPVFVSPPFLVAPLSCLFVGRVVVELGVGALSAAAGRPPELFICLLHGSGTGCRCPQRGGSGSNGFWLLCYFL